MRMPPNLFSVLGDPLTRSALETSLQWRAACACRRIGSMTAVPV